MKKQFFKVAGIFALFIFLIIVSCTKDNYMKKDNYSNLALRNDTSSFDNEMKVGYFLFRNKNFNEYIRNEIAFITFISSKNYDREKMKMVIEKFKTNSLTNEQAAQITVDFFPPEDLKVILNSIKGKQKYLVQIKKEIKPFLERNNISEREYLKGFSKMSIKMISKLYKAN